MRKIMNNLKKVGLAGVGSSISRSATGVAVALVLLSGTAFATAIGTGQGNSAGTVLVNGSGIFFSNFVTVPSPTCTSPGCTGSYTNATGTVQGSLSGAPTLTPNIVDWAEFSGTAAGLIKIDLNTLNAGFGTLAGCSSNTIGSLCTPTGSPITLAQSRDQLGFYLFEWEWNCVHGYQRNREQSHGHFLHQPEQRPGHNHEYSCRG